MGVSGGGISTPSASTISQGVKNVDTISTARPAFAETASDTQMNAVASKTAESTRATMAETAAHPERHLRRHNGGPIPKDGLVSLKAGEHVLTEAEAKQARKHALMAAGMKSLAKRGKKS